MGTRDTFAVGDWVRCRMTAVPTHCQGRLGRITRRFSLTSDWYTVEFMPGAARDQENSAWDNFRYSEIAPWQPTAEEEAQWLITALSR